MCDVCMKMYKRERERFPVFRSPTLSRMNIERYYATTTTNPFDSHCPKKNRTPPLKSGTTNLPNSHFTNTHLHRHIYTSALSLAHMCIRSKYNMYTRVLQRKKNNVLMRPLTHSKHFVKLSCKNNFSKIYKTGNLNHDLNFQVV